MKLLVPFLSREAVGAGAFGQFRAVPVLRGTTMRVWLVDDRQGEPPSNLSVLLRGLAAANPEGLTLVGSGPYRPDLLTEWRSLPGTLLVLHGPSWPPHGPLTEVFDAGLGLVVVTSHGDSERFLASAATHPVWLTTDPVDADGLILALRGAEAAMQRHRDARAEVDRLEKRLVDRIVIERAKGILTQRLGIGEEEAYRRLRVLSRRQRRPIREIAQSLLDTETLLLPEVNGLLDPRLNDTPPDAPPARAGK